MVVCGFVVGFVYLCGRCLRPCVLVWVLWLGVPGFLFRVRGGFGRVRGGVSGCFCFRSALPSSGLGGVGLGWGCFSPAVLLGPGLFRVRVWFCLESLILAQDERWRRA